MIGDVLYRIFDQREYADQFINEGSLRFRTLVTYKSIEDPSRVDREEGYGTVKQPGHALSWDPKTETLSLVHGIKNLHVEGGGEGTFICCFSSPPYSSIAELPRKFGKYVVRVNDPEALIRDIKSTMKKDASLNQNLPQLEVAPVRYDKGETLEKLTDKEIDLLGWSQKPKQYSDEYEVRFKFWVHKELIGSPQDYFLTIAKQLDYCDLIVRMD